MRWGLPMELLISLVRHGSICKAPCAQPLRLPLLAPFYQASPSLIPCIESGETMRAARLKAIDTVMESSAVLIKSSSSTNTKLINLIVSRIKGVISMFGPLFCPS